MAIYIFIIFIICLGVKSHMECIKLSLQLTRFDYFFSLVRNKTRLQFSANAKSLEIFENNAGIKPSKNCIFAFARGQYLCDHTHA